MDVSRNERTVVDESIESALGHDHVRLADVMFELVKNEEHYRVLAKHCTKPQFLERYLERMVPSRQEALAVRQIVYDDSDGEVEKDEVIGRQVPYDDSDDEGPLPAATNEVGILEAPEETAESLRQMAESRAVAPDVADSIELAGPVERAQPPTPPGAVEVELIDASDPSRMVELRPRGESAVPDDVDKLAEGDEWVPLKTRGNSMLDDVAGLEVEELQTVDDDVLQLQKDRPIGTSLEDDTQVVREMKELPKFEMVDLVPSEREAAEEELVEKATTKPSLFNPPTKPILFGQAPTSKPSVSAASSLQQRLQKKKEADANFKDQDMNRDNEADTFVLAGTISKEGTTPWVDPRLRKDSGSVDLPRILEMHSGPTGTYDRDPSGKWNRKGSDLSVS
jgi:hypothetical protein